MNATKTSCFYLLLIACLFNITGNAQQCNTCGEIPTVATYDLDVQVAEPKLNGTDSSGWLEWLQLFWLARHANGYLFTNNKNCVRFVIGPDQDANEEGIQEIGKLRYATASLPHKMYDEGYLTTGYVRQNGDGYIMHLELQSSCNRKKIAFADIPFQLSNGSEYIKNIAHQAAAKLSPLIEKIKTFEEQERKERKEFVIGGLNRDIIKIVPVKKTLTTGQTTEITIELKDCDGVNLPGREINFSKGSVGSTPIPGTIGGIVTPSTLITDVNGKARAVFKMTATSGKPAIINAHSITGTSQNCKDAFIGSAKIDALAAFKVSVDYVKNGAMNVEMKSKDSIFSITMADEEANYSVFYSASFLHYPGAATGKHFEIQGTEETSSKTIFTNNHGYSDHHKISKSPEMAVNPLGLNYKEGKDKVERIFSNNPQQPRVIFDFENGTLNSFDIDIDFPEQDNGQYPVPGGFLVIKGDPLASFTTNLINDPASPYKIEYVINYKKTIKENNSFGNSIETESAIVRILSTHKIN